MPEQRDSYRQIMKVTSIFGGIQIFHIIISILRSKFVAVLLGPLGMGISGLLLSTTEFISGLTNFGLGTSAVKNISEAYGSGNKARLIIVATVFRRLVWITGLLGTIITLVLSPWLSQLTFGNSDYTYAFMIISITLLINQISSGQGVLLRGTRQIRYMAKAGIIGSTIGLLTTIPLYYFFGIRGIVPGIIVTTITGLILTFYFVRKLDIKSIYVSRARTLAEGRGMLKMGFMISLSGLITVGVSYIVRIFISKTGGVDQVGLYNAGFAIINTYVGMIFTAMSTDYYPRLSAVSHSDHECRNLINQQAEIAILILAPVVMVFLVFINWVVIILYSTKFIAVNDMILYAALGMFFKASSWAIAFILLAKGASQLFFLNELITNVYLLAFNLLGYYYLGLSGMGISFLVAYLVYLIQVYWISTRKYNFTYKAQFVKIFVTQLALAVGCLFTVKLISSPYSYLFGSAFIIVSSIHALRELDKRIDLKDLLMSVTKIKR